MTALLSLPDAARMTGVVLAALGSLVMGSAWVAGRWRWRTNQEEVLEDDDTERNKTINF